MKREGVINVAMMGFGTVGQGVYRILQEEGARFHALTGRAIRIQRILVKDLRKDRPEGVPPGLLTDNPRTILEDPAIEIIVEVTGDTAFSLPMMREALAGGKHIITAAKAVVSEAMEELTELARVNGVSFLYEASVAGAAPILKVVRDQSRMHPAHRIQGILNGTCNYILTRMTREGLGYREALEEAQDLGYAEADPYEDVEGIDTRRKLRILGTLTLGGTLREADILCHGIASITALDLALLKKRNRVVKLLGTVEARPGGALAWVMPWALPLDSPFPQVGYSDNRVEVGFPYAGTLAVMGPGAGMLPTASAIWNDLLDCMTGKAAQGAPLGRHILKSHNADISGTYYLRLSGAGKGLALPEALLQEVLHGEGEDLAVVTRETKLLPLLETLASLAPRQWVLIALSPGAGEADEAKKA